MAIANGKAAPVASCEAGIAEQTYYRWRMDGALNAEPAKRLKEMEQENSKLKRLVAELSLDKQILQDIALGNFAARSGAVPLWGMPSVKNQSERHACQMVQQRRGPQR